MEQRKATYLYTTAIILVVIIGILIRVMQFPKIPPGFNQDEASSAYEAYSLLETGKDKWGNELPAYFPSWGSGQNVLLSYLSVPAIAIMGLNIASARIVSLIIGILTLPLFYFCLRPLGKFQAFLGLLLVSIVPWHFMLSRWGLESNLLPFFMLLGCTLLSKAINTNKKKWIIPALLPFAISLYAYGTTIMVLPFFFAAILFFNFHKIRVQITSWLLAITLFLILASPFLIFFIENYILNKNLGWTDNLFFSTPLLPSNRLSQVNETSWSDIILRNISFLFSDFNDGSNYNLMPGFKLLLSTTVPLTILGFFIAINKLLTQKGKLYLNSENKVYLIFFAWAIAALFLFITVELNVNRFNHFYIPAIVISVWAFNKIITNLNQSISKQLLQYSLICWILIEGGFAIRNYFREYMHSTIKSHFNAQLQDAFIAVDKLPVDQILITDQMPLPYVYALFFLKYPPAKFQKEADFEIKNGVYKVNNFGRYYFYKTHLDTKTQYAYLSKKGECPEKDKLKRKVVYSNDFWEVSIIK